MENLKFYVRGGLFQGQIKNTNINGILLENRDLMTGSLFIVIAMRNRTTTVGCTVH